MATGGSTRPTAPVRQARGLPEVSGVAPAPVSCVGDAKEAEPVYEEVKMARIVNCQTKRVASPMAAEASQAECPIAAMWGGRAIARHFQRRGKCLFKARTGHGLDVVVLVEIAERCVHLVRD